MNPEVIASIVAAITALVAVIIGPFVTISASKKQMLGPMRQAWINSLRDAVSEFSASIHVGQLEVPGILNQDPHVRDEAIKIRLEHRQKTFQLKEKICLLINSQEEEHKEIMRLAENAYTAYMAENDPAASLRALREWTQVVLKMEWETVKK